jgi:AraC-like DNA-binding protein
MGESRYARRRAAKGAGRVSNVEWLLHEATGARAVPISAVTRIDDVSWRADLERIEIGQGLTVYLTEAEVREEIGVEVAGNVDYPWMSGQVVIGGRARMEFLDGGGALASPEQALFFRLARARAIYRLAPRQPFQSTGYILCLKRVARLFDDDIPQVLRPLLDTHNTVAQVIPMPATRLIRSVARSLFARGLNGPLRILMIEGAVLQLLAAQAAAAINEQRVRKVPALTSGDRERIHAARRRLLADMRDPPTLGSLAAEVGLSEKRLNAGFRKRLDHARIVLKEDVPLKDVAHRVGYNHVTNFINAFTARFGAPPRKYVQQQS